MADQIDTNRLYAKPDAETHYALFTGQPTEIHLTEYRPIVDAHMHIQSNNTAPLTLQWAMFMLQLASFLNSTDEKVDNLFTQLGYKNFNLKNGFDLLDRCGIDINPLQTNKITKIMWAKMSRDTLNKIASALTIVLKDFGRIGTLDSDIVAKLFMQDVNQLRVKEIAFGFLMSEEILKEIINKRAESFQEFTAHSSYYYRGLIRCYFNLLLPMDMSHAHYWGNYGLPVYFPLGTGQYYYINDYLFSLSIVDNVIHRVVNIKDNSAEVIKRIQEQTPLLLEEVGRQSERLKRQIDDSLTNLNTELSRHWQLLMQELEKINAQDLEQKLQELLRELAEAKKQAEELKDELLKQLTEQVEEYSRNEIEKYREYQEKEPKDGFFYLDNYLEHRTNEISEEIANELVRRIERLKEELIPRLRELQDVLQQIAQEAEQKITTISRSLIETAKQKASQALTYFREKLPVIRDRLVASFQSVKRAVEVYIIGGGKLIPYDIDLERSQDYFFFGGPLEIDYRSQPQAIPSELTPQDYTAKYLTKKYNHFLEVAPGNERSDFEDYYLQIDHTKASCMRYPYFLLPFYHADPRRFYKGSGYINQLIAKLRANHAFFLTERDEVHKLKLTPLEFTDKYLKEDLFSSRNKTPYEKIFSDFIRPNGLFWGIKLYTELGYPPFLFDEADEVTRRSFKNLFPGQFEHFGEILKQCAAKGIPVTCHGSPRGMTIADTYIYLREYRKTGQAENKPFLEALFDVTPENLLASIDHVDREFVSPDAWRKVLSKGEYENLRINLAHFGGYSAWVEDKGEFDWRTKLSALIAEKSNVYTDLACYVNVKDNLPAMLTDEDAEKIKPEDRTIFETGYEKKTGMFDMGFIGIHNWQLVKTRHIYKLRKNLSRSMFSRLRDVLRNAGIIEDDIDKLADGLVSFLKGQYGSALKEKVMMGSDWPMFEKDIGEGAGGYYSRMFELLKRVTRKLNEYDVWHQFAVINPLKFVGLLTDENTIDMNKVQEHKAAIEKELNGAEWDLNKRFHIIPDEKDEILTVKIPNKLKEMNHLSKSKIKPSTEIKQGGEFVILKDWQ